jgi:hypothetical protein
MRIGAMVHIRVFLATPHTPFLSQRLDEHETAAQPQAIILIAIDRYRGPEMIRVFSKLAVASAVVPIFATFVGGLSAALGDERNLADRIADRIRSDHGPDRGLLLRGNGLRESAQREHFEYMRVPRCSP